MCSVLFLDIVEYSKKSVSGQISLKERFNAYLSVAIRDVPLDDRIILDTGDGAALSFLGDVEDALQVALSLRESLRSEAAHMDPPLLVRMGINLGPVRLVKDINNQPNIVGDGINVAQRIMGFADPGQIQVSRSYFDAVSRLSHEYGNMFHYQGSRTDKHVREHEIYAIGYPGEFTSLQPATSNTVAKWQELSRQLGEKWQIASQRLGEMTQAGIALYRAASPRQRAIYGGGAAGAVVLVLLIGLLVHHAPASKVDQVQATDGKPATTASSSTGDTSEKSVTTNQKPSAETAKAAPVLQQGVEAGASTSKPSSPVVPKQSTPAKKPASKPRTSTKPSTKTNIFGMPMPTKGKPGYLTVVCTNGTSVFVDGFSKGSIKRGSIRISLDPGKHRLTITHANKPSVYSEVIRIRTGETLRLHPAFCD